MSGRWGCAVGIGPAACLPGSLLLVTTLGGVIGGA
jgi:hypothetical protein